MKRKIFILEFIMAAHVTFCIIIEMQSVIFPHSPKLTDLDNQQQKKNTHANHNSYFDLFGFFGLCFWLILKYLFEGFRFNSLLIMAAYTLFFFDRALQFADKILCQVSALLTLLFIWTIITYPVYELPKPTGKYRTCYKQIKLNDNYRSDVSVFYPCADNKQDDIEYKWLPNKQFAKQIYQRIILRTRWNPSEWLFDVGFNFLSFLTFKACPEQPLVNNNLDVIIFSHGFTQHRNAYTAYCQQLASEGYIVFSFQHLEMVYPWDVKQTKIYKKGNYPEIIEKYQKIRGAHLQWRCEQIISLIQSLKNQENLKNNVIKGVFYDFNPQSINLIGHSFGGGTILRVNQEIEVDSVIALDPWLFPFNNDELRKIIKSKTLILSKDKELSKDEVFDPNQLIDFLKVNPQIIHHKIKYYDHPYPADLTYFIGAEMTIFGELRSDDKIQELNNLLATITSKFIKDIIFIDENKYFIDLKK